MEENQLFQGIGQWVTKSPSTGPEPAQCCLNDQQVSFQWSKRFPSLDACPLLSSGFQMCIPNVCSPSLESIPFCQEQNCSHIKLLRGAHGEPACKPAINPSSQARASRVSASDSALHSAGTGDNNRCSTANQCTRPGVPTWV